MIDKPNPPVAADVDLRGYEFMPLYGHHLFGSDFNARVSDAGWRAAMTLWWAAWNQVPAASLPNDDVALTRLADLGRDLKAFRKIKGEALHGFTECSDGRLYHKALAVWALEAWDRRVKERQRKANWRAAKHREKDGTETGTHTGQETGQQRDVPAEGKRSEAKGSEVENRASGVTPTVTASANGSHVAAKAIGTSKAGQQWSSMAYVAATAKTLDIPRRRGESDAEFKDRVVTAVQSRQRSAEAETTKRSRH
jgi:hypothetical protein